MTDFICLDCGEELGLSPETEIEIGDIVVCENCGLEMEITNIDPFTLDHLMVEK